MPYKYVRKAMRSKPKTTKTTKAPTKSLVTLIKSVSTKVAQGELETKYVSANTNNLTFNSEISAGFGEMYSLIPPCQPPSLSTSAAGDWQRANNEITPISVRTHWTFSVGDIENTRSVNIIGVLFCLQAKSVRHFNDLNVYLTGPKFLKSGNSTQIQQFNGLPSDLQIPINLDDFTLLHKKIFHLQKNVGQQNGDLTTAGSPNSSPSVFMHSFHLNVPKSYKYTPGTGQIYPQGHAPFWVLGYCHVDGSPPDVINRDLVASWSTQMVYKDA